MTITRRGMRVRRRKRRRKWKRSRLQDGLPILALYQRSWLRPREVGACPWDKRCDLGAPNVILGAHTHGVQGTHGVLGELTTF